MTGRKAEGMAELLRAGDVARILGISPAWVYQHSCGKRRPNLPSVRLGGAVRFRAEAIERFIAEQEQGRD